MEKIDSIYEKKSNIILKFFIYQNILTMSNKLDSIKPIFRWAGSKRQLIPMLSMHWKQSYKRYIEPFAGSASLFFHLSPEEAILGDINDELMSTYIQLKTNVQSLLNSLKILRKSKKQYLSLRALEPNSLTPSARAARFIYLNRFCFNGLYRTNRNGNFNVPYSGDKTGAIPSKAQILRCSSKLQKAVLMTDSFENTLMKVEKGDFVYIDPPYAVKGKRVFKEYNASYFNDHSLKILREWMIELDRNGISFLVSYANSAESKILAKGFYSKLITVKRNISCYANKRKTEAEVLIFNIKL
jgi:DNA adenine methylase